MGSHVSGRFSSRFDVNRIRVRTSVAISLILAASVAAPAAARVPIAANAITTENEHPGDAGWRIPTPGHRMASDAGGQISGYASETSVAEGSTVALMVSVAPAQEYSIDIYRVGWYGGIGGRLLDHIGPLAGSPQKPCRAASRTGLIECHWSVSYRLSIPPDWITGVYLGVLTNSAGFQSYITFVVRDDRSTATYLYEQPVNTYEAYNAYPLGSGKSLYPYNSHGAPTVSGGLEAVKVSFDRPYSPGGAGDLLRWEVHFIRFVERNGYDIAYSTDVDTATRATALTRHRAFLSVGHDEYWDARMYDNVTRARDAGVNLGFFGANDIYWQIRYERSSAGVPNRVIACYKDSGAAADPARGTPRQTTMWRKVGRPEQALIGVMYAGNPVDVPFVVRASSDWVYRGTGLHNGDRIPGLVGYEYDRWYPAGPQPTVTPGTYRIISASPLISRYGLPSVSNAAVYEAPGGAWVFAAGTIQWSWGLDDFGSSHRADPRVQRVTANVLARFADTSAYAP